MSAPTDAPQERVDLLDPELQAAYNATPWVKLSNASVPMIRSAGGVSKPIAIPDEVEVIEVEDGSVAGMLYKKRGGQEDAPLVVWNHGGGYIFGFPALHASLYVQFVLDFGASVFAVKYPLAPEHPFPAANEAAIEAWKWATTGGIAKYGLKPQRGRVALGGTSAGGGLAMTTALRIRDSKGNLERPAGVILNIPWLAPPPTEPESTPTSYTTVKFDKIWSLANCTYAYNAWYPNRQPDPQGYAFAANAPSLAGLPPVQVNVSEYDILRDSSIAFAQRLFTENEAGAELHVHRGAYHGNTGAVPQATVSRAHDMAQIRFAKRVLTA